MPDIKYRPLKIEEEILREKETPTPCIFELEKNSKKLICFGIKHTNNFSDRQFKKFDEVLENLGEGIVLVEAEDRLLKTQNKNFPNELGYIIPRVIEENLEIKGIDLNMLGEILKFSKKYEAKDIVLIRSLAFLNKPGEKNNLKKNISRVANLISKEKDFSDIYLGAGLNEISLLALVEDYIKKVLGKNLNEIMEEDNLFPSPLENKHALNKICRDISYDRDAFMLKNLKETLENYDNVLYVLGKNHIIRQEETIRKIIENLV